MSEHYCKEHETVWFKKGKMPRYAHPIEGTEPTEWCNEEESPKAPAKPKGDIESPARQASIETQNAYTGVPAIVELLTKYPQEPLVNAAYNYAMSKLGNWSSMGVAPDEQPVETPPQGERPPKIEKPTKEQGVRLTEALKGYTEKDAKGILIERWQTNTARQLNKEQMEDFITQLEKGKPKGLEPGDIPF